MPKRNQKVLNTDYKENEPSKKIAKRSETFEKEDASKSLLGSKIILVEGSACCDENIIFDDRNCLNQSNSCSNSRSFRELLNESKLLDTIKFSSFRPWRFVQQHHMNVFTKRLCNDFSVSSMNIVEEINDRMENKSEIGGYDHINTIVFIDLDNWACFFNLPELLPKKTHVYGFKGAKTSYKTPKNNSVYDALSERKMITIANDVGSRHDAADFALTFKVSKLHDRLPHRIAFLIVSGDYGFIEVLNQLKDSKRIVCFANPHMQKGSKSDPHYNEKMKDDHNLLDIIKIANYLSLAARDNAEIVEAGRKRLDALKNNLGTRISKISL